MKKNHFGSLLFVAAFFTACSDNSSSTAGTTDSSGGNMSTTSPTDNTAMKDTGTGSASTNMSTGDTASKVGKMDKDFVMKAASGGMMEVEAANIAMQNASSERVKGYASMMITDHGKANTELKSVAASKNITVPTSLMPEHQKHLDMLKDKKGKDFDKAYMTMMLADHKKDISEFEKASKMCEDADCKGFAAKTLPVLRTHLDSAQAISKMKM